MNPTHKTIEVPVYFDGDIALCRDPKDSANCLMLDYHLHNPEFICKFNNTALDFDMGAVWPNEECPLHGGEDE